MVAKEILSVQHPLIKQAVALRLERAAREQSRRVLIVGKKMIRDLSSLLSFEDFFFVDTPPSFSVQNQIRVSKLVLKKITGLEEPDGWAGIALLPSETSLTEKKRILILDQLADPGNLGTLIRSAFGLGWDGIWLTPGTVDLFNDKALRAAKGATFRIGYEWVQPEEILLWAKKQQASLWVADLQGSPLSEVNKRTPLALILSNEAHGPAHWTNSLRKVTIPMKESLESLNVASAGAILLYGLGSL